jgi:hypothetical protein
MDDDQVKESNLWREFCFDLRDMTGDRVPDFRTIWYQAALSN